MIHRFLFAALLLIALVHSAQAIDPIHVVSHDKVLVVTDPSQGVKYYPQWAVFPPVKTDYRRVVLSITYRCPDAKRCGEWDYIDGVLLTSTKHAVGTIAGKKQIELARVISPYGWQFDSTWFFTWKADVSDFGMLLHDSCEITFKHTGYESNTDRGWVVTLDFEITPGRAPMKCLGIDTLWSGSFPYGDSSKPIDSLLRPFKISDPKAKYARVWLMQTGHGMDETENCAEFCRKWRKLILNDGTRDTLIDQRDLWKECSENPLYPQAGTWPFDRANWCPGDVVTPDIYTFPINSKKDHSLLMQMQPYAAAKPTANWYLDGYVFYYEEPWAKWDVGITTTMNLSRRQRAYGLTDEIIRNHAVLRASRCRTDYEYLNQTGEWYLPWHKLVNISQMFDVEVNEEVVSQLDDCYYIADSLIAKVQLGGKSEDQFLDDNAVVWHGSVDFSIWSDTIILEFKTNRAIGDNSFFLSSEPGCEDTSIFLRPDTIFFFAPTELDTNRVFSIRLPLQIAQYFLKVTDTAGDGLGFWFNPEAGYGYVRLLDSQGRLLKAFTPDFGGSLYYSFIVTDDSTKITPPDSTPQVIVFPPRNFGTFDIDLFASWPTDMTIEIVSDSGEVVLSQKHDKVKQLTLPMDITAQKDGIYYVHVITERDLIKKRIRLKRS